MIYLFVLFATLSVSVRPQYVASYYPGGVVPNKCHYYAPPYNNTMVSITTTEPPDYEPVIDYDENGRESDEDEGDSFIRSPPPRTRNRSKSRTRSRTRSERQRFKSQSNRNKNNNRNRNRDRNSNRNRDRNKDSDRERKYRNRYDDDSSEETFDIKDMKDNRKNQGGSINQGILSFFNSLFRNSLPNIGSSRRNFGENKIKSSFQRKSETNANETESSNEKLKS